MNIKKISVVVLAVATLVCVSSCQKDKSEMTFKATAERSKDDMKVSLSGGQLRWSSGDAIKVFNNRGNWGKYVLTSAEGSADGTFHYTYSKGGTELQENQGRYCAVYPASFNIGRDSVKLPREQYTTNGSLRELPMYATSMSNYLEFYNICGVVRFRLTASSSVNLRGIAVTTNRATNGTATISGSGTSTTIMGLNGTTTTTLLCETAQDITTQKDFYMYLPADIYSTFSIRLTADDWSTCTMVANGSIRVQRGKITTINLPNLNFAEQPIKFSVGNGRTVHFSKGNLQYIGSAATPYWKFAEHQYDYFGTSTRQNTNRMDVNRDLFGWGTSGWNNRNYFYMPYNTSNSLSAPYTEDKGFGYGPTDGSSYTYSLTGAYDSADWGVYNAIRNGGNTAGMWRTLTKDEWNYLLHRPSKVGFATVENKHGIILLPDNFTDPMKNDGNGAFVPATTVYENNVYKGHDWIAMELAGAVFLPAAGIRYYTTADSFEAFGFYWSSSHASSGYAESLRFNQDDGLSMTTGYRFQGYSVRLVRD